MFNFKKELGLVFIISFTLLVSPCLVSADWSQTATFFTEPVYDLYDRSQVDAVLVQTTNKFYFYADKYWYDNLIDKNKLSNQIYTLATNFEYKTYPVLTSLLGSEDNPGIDNDSRLVVVLLPLKNNYGGYLRTADRYSRQDYPASNEGQVIFLNGDSLRQKPIDLLDYQLAHEFTHLIVLNQKPEANVWLQELYAELSPTLLQLNYNDNLLKKRAQDLLYSPEINLVSWNNSDKDYGKVKLFGQYLYEQYGSHIFSEALKDPSGDGVVSFNRSLFNHQAGISFADIFLDWLITNVINDCSVSDKYCYKTNTLSDFSIIPYTYYLPPQAQSSLSVTDSLSAWTGKWQKIIGGSGSLKLKFSLPQTSPDFKIAYLVEDIEGKKTVNFLNFANTKTQEVYLQDMGTKNVAVYFIPVLGAANEENQNYYYSWEAANITSSKAEDELIASLLAKIEELRQEVNRLQTQLAWRQNNPYNASFMLANSSSQICGKFLRDLYYGLRSPEVQCLQQFLSGLDGIYPEKLITGYYGPLTQAAVKRYQVSKGIIATGYFGPLTRAQANQEL